MASPNEDVNHISIVPESLEMVGVEEDKNDIKECIDRVTATAGETLDQTSHQVDDFLCEALQNPRDRLTILRLEQEIQKFIRNTKQQQLEFQPMASSYIRLAAHRVAQHYYLKSMVIDSNEGTRIVVSKTSESRHPFIRLSDVPIKAAEEDKSVKVVAPARLAIKQRPATSSIENLDCRKSSKLDPVRSVEERKEEYNKARARIFCEGPGEEILRICCPIGLVKADDNRLELDRHDILKMKEASAAGSGAKTCSKADKENMSRADKENKNRPKLNTNRVAIFRDREKDKKDPDYDRSYDRYSQRFDPGFGLSLGPRIMCAPATSYNTDFSQLGDCIRQVQVAGPQYTQASWMAPVNYRPGVGVFNAGQIAPHAAVSFLTHAPQLMYPGPSIADEFYRSLSQARPEARYVQARPC